MPDELWQDEMIASADLEQCVPLLAEPTYWELCSYFRSFVKQGIVCNSN
jgi:hypothetical protein